MRLDQYLPQFVVRHRILRSSEWSKNHYEYFLNIGDGIEYIKKPDGHKHKISSVFVIDRVQIRFCMDINHEALISSPVEHLIKAAISELCFIVS